MAVGRRNLPGKLEGLVAPAARRPLAAVQHVHLIALGRLGVVPLAVLQAKSRLGVDIAQDAEPEARLQLKVRLALVAVDAQQRPVERDRGVTFGALDAYLDAGAEH